MASIKKDLYSILRAPRITEKAANAGANTVVFEVHPDANKIEIDTNAKNFFMIVIINYYL